MIINKIHFDILDSTNAKARELAFDSAPEGTLVLAEHQTAGRGRLGRSWEDDSSNNIMMSMILRPVIAMEHISMITIISAMAVCKAINDISGIGAKIKWPNDVVCRGKKICGILSEGILGDRPVVILGIGVNVGTKTFAAGLDDKRGSVDLLSGKETDREALIDKIWEYFFEYYERLSMEESLASMVEEYNACTISIDSHVERTAYNSNEELKGTARGIDATGNLIIELEDGQMIHLGSGEIAQNLNP